MGARTSVAGTVSAVVAAASLLSALACGAAHGPVLDRGEKPPSVEGTISGIVRAQGSNAPLGGRTVTATEVATGARYDVTTASNGGYTMKVPAGRYRLEVELRTGETLVDQPAELTLGKSDLDGRRNFLIATKDDRR